MKGGQKMIWEEMDYNKPKLTMTQRLSYEREPAESLPCYRHRKPGP